MIVAKPPPPPQHFTETILIMLAVMLDMKDRLAVVIGGGPVAQRKARTLRHASAKVRLVCLESCPDGEWSEVDWLQEAYRPDHLYGAHLVVAAATSSINRLVARDCKQRGLLVNVADQPGDGDFYFPSAFHRDQFVVAVGTGGAAPILARKVSAELEAQFDAAYGTLVMLMGTLRPLARELFPDPASRCRAFEALLARDWLERIRAEDLEIVRTDLEAALRQHVDRLEQSL